MKALLIIKPEALEKVGDIINTLKKNNITILNIKTCLVNEDQASKLYTEHKGKYFYETLIRYLTLGNCMMIAVEGDEEVILKTKQELRQQYKPNDWEQILECCINLFAQQKINITQFANTAHFTKCFKAEFVLTFDAIHCSDSNKGETEISLFFKNDELQQKKATHTEMVQIIIEKMANANQYCLRNPKFFGGNTQ